MTANMHATRRLLGRPAVLSLSLVVALALLVPVLLPKTPNSRAVGLASKRVSASAQQAAATPAAEMDPQVKAVLDQMAAAGVLHPRTLQAARSAYAFYATLSGTPEKVFRVEDRKIPGPAGDIPIRLYASLAGPRLPIWVFFHGGGFVAGSLDSHDTPLRAIANRCGCLIVSVGYRLAPESRYPAAPNDAMAATQWVADNANEIGGDATRIAVGGDGAGGNLAAVVALMARDRVASLALNSRVPGGTETQPATGGWLRVRYQVLIYPTLDLSLETRSWVLSQDPVFTTDSMSLMASSYVPMLVDPEGPYLSPMNAPNFQNLPSTFLVTDQDDPMWDEGQTYAQRLQAADVPLEVSSYPTVIHGFFLMAGQLDAGKKVIAEIAAHLREVFASGDMGPS